MKYFTVLFSVLALIFSLNGNIYALDPPPTEQEEAPATVWDMNIGDTEVDLYLAGYWKIGLIGGVSVESGSSGIVFPAAFPGLTDFRFYQEPDLTISLWLMNRFYLETSFLEGFDKNTYAIGYRGMDGEFIQTVRIGNSDIKIDDYKGINVPSPQYNTPGISASFQTAKSYHDILFRYDPTSEHKKVFLGEYEISEELIGTGAYKKGQYFILPDNNIDFIEVYIADRDGIYSGSDNKKYKKATENEVYYSLADGTVSLFESSETDVLVYYEKGVNAVGDLLITDFIPPLVNGEPDPSDIANYKDFSWTEDDTWFPDPVLEDFQTSSSVTVNSRKSLRVFNPQKFGPFEYFNVYEISSPLPPDLWRTSVFLADNSFIEADDSDTYKYIINIDDKTVSVYNSADGDIRSPWSRYPLADTYPQNYGSEETDKSLTGKSLLVSIKNQTGLNLGSGVVPGSEQIFINGYETGTAVVDYNSGELSFANFIFPQDRIVVLYRTETTDLSGGDLLFAQGNRFYPSDYLQFHLAEMFRWNITSQTSSTVDSTSPGGLTIAGGLTYKKDNLNIELTSSLGLQTPDTTGYLRLLGMEESGYSFSVGQSLIKAAPLNVWDGSATLLSPAKTDLIYTDYYSTNGLGQYFLNSYNWSGATADPTLEGPTIASKLSSDTFDSNVMVLEYDLAGSQWSAGDLLLSPDDPIDLSRFTSFSVNFKKLDTTGGDIVVKILIGETGEKEDWNDDGFISDEDNSQIVSIDVPVSILSTDDEWKTLKHYFTSAEMKQLTKSRSIRILIDDSSPAASGRLLVSGIHFDGSLFNAELFDNLNSELSIDDQLNITEISDTTSDNLITSFSEVLTRFHSSGEDQKALKIQWGNPLAIAADDYWIATTNTSPVPADTYNSFSFYSNNDAASLSGTYEINLTDSRDRGYHFSYAPGSAGWEKLTLSLETGKITDSSGAELTTALIDNLYGELTKFSITGSGTTTGIMYIDELHFSDPTFSIKGNVELITDFSYPGDILSTSGGFPVLANFSISNIFTYSGSSVLSSVTNGFNAIQNSTSLTFELLMLFINANLKVDWNQETTDLSGSHKLLYPTGFAYGHIADSYSRAGTGDSASMTRSNAFRFNVPDAGHIEISTESNGNSDVLLQSWNGQTEWSVASLFHIGGTLIFEQNSLWDKRDQKNYFTNWIDDYRLILPLTESVNSRSVKGNLDLILETVPIGFTLKPQLSFDNELISTESIQTNRGGFVLTIPIKITTGSDREWSIIPAYSRLFMSKSTKPLSNSFTEGLNNLFNDLNTWMPLVTFIPFYELFALDSVDKFADKTSLFSEASYSPEFGISINRKFGSNIYDLFLPYSFNVNFIRSMGKKDDTYYNKNRFEFSFRQNAVNLFGNFGVYQLFSFYNTEELSSSLQFNLSVEGSNIPQPEELIFQNYLSFYSNNNSVITFENRFETDFENTSLSDTLDFKFLWQRPMKQSFSLGFLNDLIKKEHFWSHEENLALTFLYPWQQSENIQSSQITINIKHLSQLTVPGMGALRGWIKLGFFNEAELFKAGFEAGIELEVNF